eukprot:PhM_4_TR1113/c0_g1_i1/m.3809
MRTLLFVALLVIAVSAQNSTDVPSALTVNSPTHPFGSSMCALTGKYENKDKSDYYQASFSGVKKLCVKDYLDLCATVTGVQTCNKATHMCVEVEYSWDDAVQYPSVASVMAKRPEICIEAGAFRAPDSAVVHIAQILFSGLFLVAGLVVFVTQVQVAAPMKAFAGVYTLLCMLLLFSYFYLN